MAFFKEVSSNMCPLFGGPASEHASRQITSIVISVNGRAALLAVHDLVSLMITCKAIKDSIMRMWSSISFMCIGSSRTCAHRALRVLQINNSPELVLDAIRLTAPPSYSSDFADCLVRRAATSLRGIRVSASLQHQLEKIVYSCREIQSLTIDTSQGVDSRAVIQAVRSLTLRCKKLSVLRITAICHPGNHARPQRPQYSTLVLHGSTSGSFGNTLLRTLARSDLKSLQRIALPGLQGLRMSAFHDFAINETICRSLIELDLSHTKCLASECLQWIACAKHVQVLHLREAFAPAQHHMALADWVNCISELKSLRELDVRNIKLMEPALALRCVEFHTYQAGGGLLDVDHRDTGSAVSMSILLSDAAQMDGGRFVTWGASGPTAHALARGDAVLFDSEKRHNVTTVRRGVRHSLVLELWCGPRNALDRDK